MKIGKKILLLFFVTGMMPVNAIGASPAQKNSSASVIVATVEKEPITDIVEALGTLRANETVTLMATVTQTVTAINFTDGQRVSKGDILVEMASGQEKAQLEQERALVAEARRRLDRIRPLVAQGATSQSALDAALSEHDTAKARLQEIQSRLKDYLIVAPFDGVVGLRNISVGTLIQPGTKITTLDDDTQMKLDFAVPSVFIADLKPGASVIATAREFQERKFHGKVSSIDSQIDPITRSIIVRALIQNEDHALKPGLLMTVQLLTNPREAVVIPENSLIPEGKNHFVIAVASGNIAEKRQVVLGTRQAGRVEIQSGLAAGEQIVTRGPSNIHSGQKLNIVAEDKGQPLSEMLEKQFPGENSATDKN